MVVDYGYWSAMAKRDGCLAPARMKKMPKRSCSLDGHTRGGGSWGLQLPMLKTFDHGSIVPGVVVGLAT